MNKEVQASIIVVAGRWSETLAGRSKTKGDVKNYGTLLKDYFDKSYEYLYAKFNTD